MHRSNNRGAALVAVLCVMAVLVVLGLSMLLASSVLTTRANAKQFEEQCRVSAVTMAKEVEKSLYTEGSEIYNYMQTNIQGNWVYYNPDELGHGVNAGIYRDFTMQDSSTDKTGNLSLRAYWEWARDGELSDILLHLELTAEKGSSKYIVKSSYTLSVNDAGMWAWNLYERNG